MSRLQIWALCLLGMMYRGQVCQADIFRYPGPVLIPGTEGITPGPNVQLNNMALHGADLSNVNLTGANFESSTLREANFRFSNLSNARLVNADLRDAVMLFANLSNANLTGALIDTAVFNGQPSEGGLTHDQLITTASYQANDLHGVWFLSMDLTGWDFRGQNLQNARIQTSQLAGANFESAQIQGMRLDRVSNFAQQHLMSTASYQDKDLRGLDISGMNWNGIDLRSQDLTDSKFEGCIVQGANFQGANLTRAAFSGTMLQGADFRDADLTEAYMSGATGFGLTEAQLVSSYSYQVKNLLGIDLAGSDLRQWNFQGVNLSNANLSFAYLQGTDLTGANLNNARLDDARMKGVNVNTATTYNQWTTFPSDFDPVTAGLTRVTSPVGDLNGDGLLDTADLDALTRGIRGQLGIAMHLPIAAVDFNHDDLLDSADRDFWLTSLHPILLGDANVDGSFDSSDLVVVFQYGQYEDFLPENSGWKQGDWNGDGDFSSDDFVTVFSGGCYESACVTPRFAHTVPEPSGLCFVALAGVIVAVRHRSSLAHADE